MSSYRQYPPRNNNGFQKPAPKIIYADQEIFVGCKNDGGYYMFHTTADPTNKFKQNKIGDLMERPAKEFVEEMQRYGQQGEKRKWLLKKEAIESWLEEEYGYTLSTDESPFAPKKIGVVSAKRSAPAAKNNSDDSDTEDEGCSSPPKKKQAVSATQSEPSADLTEMKEILAKQQILLQEILTHLRNQNQNHDSTNPVQSQIQSIE